MPEAALLAAARRPAAALRQRMEALELDASPGAAATAVALFESVFWRLPPFADDLLPLVAAACYARLGRDDPAFLLAGLAAQWRPEAPETHEARRLLAAHRPAAGHAAAAAAAAGARILAAPVPADNLQTALEQRTAAGDWAGAAALLEGVWPSLPPVEAYWVHFHAMQTYAALGRSDAALLFAALTVQFDPMADGAPEAYRRLQEIFRQAGRADDSAAVAARADALLAVPSRAADLNTLRQDRIVHAADERPAQSWRLYGGGVPHGLRQPRTAMRRPAVSLAELLDADVLICGHAVAVFDAAGGACPDLSVGAAPALLRRRLEAMRRAGTPVRRATLETAVLALDEFPHAKICHYLLDHATRLLVYRDAGVDLRQVTVIGPPPQTGYQHDTAARLGVGAWQSTAQPARLRVRRLLVSSNCHQLRHPAHWGAAWAVDGVRALFDLAPRQRTRRLLISRADSDYRRLANEAALMALLAPLGFETIVPGRLSFAEQIAAFRDATHIVGPHGAGLANILFAAPGTHVLEVFHPLYGTWAYAVLAGAIGLDYGSLLGRDALSDAAEVNDPDWPHEQRNLYAGRDMLADPHEVRRWLGETGAG